jgi:hypothetical protein
MNIVIDFSFNWEILSFNFELMQCYFYCVVLGAVMAAIVWYLNLQLHIATDVVSSNLDQGEDTTLCDKVCQWLEKK